MSDRFALTWYGNKIYFDDVLKSRFDIRDIAHSAAVIPRWTGHTNWEDYGYAYSVAQHALWCQVYVREAGGTRQEQLCALLHDAAESFIGDLNTNAKRRCEDYRLLEDELLEWIFCCVKLPSAWACELPYIVKEADEQALLYEGAHVCHYEMLGSLPPAAKSLPLGMYRTAYGAPGRPWRPGLVKTVFLSSFSELTL